MSAVVQLVLELEATLEAHIKTRKTSKIALEGLLSRTSIISYKFKKSRNY